MDATENQLIAFVVMLEVLQLIAFWAFVHRRYQLSLLQLGRMAAQLATGTRPVSYYVDGPLVVGQLAQNLENLGTLLDGLERRQQEEEFNLGVLLANMVEGVMVVDPRHIVRLVNDELLKLFDLKTSPINRTVLEALRESRVELIVREALRAGVPQRQELVLQSAAGRPARHFEVSAVPIRTKTGEIGGAVLVFHEVTRDKQLETMRTEFIANVSHELRTPLAIFRGYLETLRDHPELPPAEVRRVLEAMQRHSERLNALVEDLMVLTRMESRQTWIEFSTVRLAAFFRQLLKDWKQRANGDEATITLEIPDDLPPVEVDPLRFEQVMLNLLENAVVYSQPPRRIRISATHEKDEIEIRVVDSGIGIPPSDLPHIFERFYRVDKARGRVSGGTGLGLSIVKQIMQSHHGSVRAESELGQGTTIVLRLPVRQED